MNTSDQFIIDSLLLSLPLHINNLESATNILLRNIKGYPLSEFLNKKFDEYIINSEDDAFIYYVHYMYNKFKQDIDNRLPLIMETLILANENYNSYKEKIIKCYRCVGLEINEIPDITIVDEYPRPYQNLKGRALAPDKTDQARYGIPNTMYIRRPAIREVLIPVIISHELFHYHIKDSGLLARGIEEALADFLSIFVFTAENFGTRFALNYFVATRYARGSTSQRFDLYVDDLIKLYILLDDIGWTKISAACRQGRKSLKAIEYSFQSIEQCEKNTSNEVIERAKRLLKSLLINTPRNQVISALSIVFMLSKNDSSFKIKMNDQLKQVALDEIQKRIFGVIHDNGNVEFDDFDYLSKNFTLIIDTSGVHL